MALRSVWYVKLKEMSILMHLQIILAESDNITDSKLYVRWDSQRKETFFLQLAFVYILAAG